MDCVAEKQISHVCVPDHLTFVLIPTLRVANHFLSPTAGRAYTCMENHMCRHQGRGSEGFVVCRGHVVAWIITPDPRMMGKKQCRVCGGAVRLGCEGRIHDGVAYGSHYGCVGACKECGVS
jgi:hypothetical protein